MNFTGSCILAGQVSTAGVDMFRLQPWISMGTVLQGSLAVVRADCHVALLVEDVICRLGHIWEPATLGWATTVEGFVIFSRLLFNVFACERSVILALGFQLLVGEVGSKGNGFHVV